MRVRIIKRDGYGDRYGAMHQAGSTVEYPDHIALKLIKSGVAVPVREKPIERAVAAPPETTDAGALDAKDFSPKKRGKR